MRFKKQSKMSDVIPHTAKLCTVITFKQCIHLCLVIEAASKGYPQRSSSILPSHNPNSIKARFQ